MITSVLKSKRLLFLPPAVLLLVLVLVTTVLAANLITNGSFEDGTISGDDSPFFETLGVGDTNIDPWSIDSGTVDLSDTSLWPASVGDKSLDMDGLTFPGSVSQPITTVSGQVYKVKFDMAGNPGGPPMVKTLQACAGTTCQTFTFALPFGEDFFRPNFVPGMDIGWVEKSFLFPATDATTTLTFTSLTTGSNCLDLVCNSWGPTLDNVQVKVVPTKVVVCHKGKNTISISTNALAAHLAHGDTQGPC